MIVRTESQKAMLRDVVARNERGQEWITLADLTGSGRPYDRERTAGALVRGGYLEHSQYVYRATQAGVEWCGRDSQRDSLGRRRGGPRPTIPSEVIDRARQFLAQRDQDGRQTYSMQEVAKMVGMNRNTLYLYLHPSRRKRRQDRRRENYKKEEK